MDSNSRDREDTRKADSQLTPVEHAAPEGDFVTELPIMDDLMRLVRKLKNFPESPVNRVVSASDIRELEKAVGLIDAIAFTIEDPDEAETPMPHQGL